LTGKKGVIFTYRLFGRKEYTMENLKMFVNNEWVDAKSGTTFDDFDPFTGELYAKVPNAGAEDVEAVMKAAYDARAGWRNTPPTERAKLLRDVAQLMENKRMEFANILQRERKYCW